MNTLILEKVNKLPPEKQQEVEDFVEYLLSKYEMPEQASDDIIERRRQNAGRLRGQIWMSDDFNETPED